MTLSARDRRAIVFGGLALGIIFAGHFVLRPWIDDWADTRAQIVEDRKELADVQERLSDILGQRRRLEQRFGPAANEPLEDLQTAKLSLLKAAQEVLSAGGFKASEYRPQRPRQALPKMPEVQIVALELPGQCNFAQLVKSLAGLRKAKTLVFVEKFSITNDEKKPGKLTATITLATLAQKPKAPL